MTYAAHPGGVLFYIMLGTGIDRSAEYTKTTSVFRQMVHTHIHIVGTPLPGCPKCRERHAGRSLQTKRNRTLSCAVICVGITYFHGPSPGNYRRRK